MSFSIPLLGAAVTAAQTFRRAIETEGGGMSGDETWSLFYDHIGLGCANPLAASTPAKAILSRSGGLEGAVNAVNAVVAAEAAEAADEANVATAKAAQSAYS